MGKVYIVGAGPGDPELLTIKALKIIQDSDVILYDSLVNKDILNFAKKECKLIYVGKRKNNHTSQSFINELLTFWAENVKTVVRLKGGDPFIFGRGGEECLFLKEKNIEFEVIPGISSIMGASAYSGIPITHRGLSSSFIVLTAHECNKPISSKAWQALKFIDTAVILMGASLTKEIAKKLIELGINKKIALIEKATTEFQKTYIFSPQELLLSNQIFESPTTIIIGDVVELHKYITWFKPYKLATS